MSIAEIIVTLGGLGVIGFLAWFFFGPKQAQTAQVKGNVQEITVTVKGGYSPDVIRVQKDVPLRLIFDRQVAGAIRIEPKEFASRYKELLPQDKQIIAYCT